MSQKTVPRLKYHQSNWRALGKSRAPGYKASGLTTTVPRLIFFFSMLGVLDKLYNRKSLDIVFMIFFPGHTFSSEYYQIGTSAAL